MPNFWPNYANSLSLAWNRMEPIAQAPLVPRTARRSKRRGGSSRLARWPPHAAVSACCYSHRPLADSTVLLC